MGEKVPADGPEAIDQLVLLAKPFKIHTVTSELLLARLPFVASNDRVASDFYLSLSSKTLISCLGHMLSLCDYRTDQQFVHLSPSEWLRRSQSCFKKLRIQCQRFNSCASRRLRVASIFANDSGLDRKSTDSDGVLKGRNAKCERCS
jgi:hypothetical protein